MKRFLSLLLVFVMLVALAGCSRSEPGNDASDKEGGAEKVTMRVGIGLADTHPQYYGLVKFKEEVEAATNGKFEVQINHSGTVGDDRTMMEMLQMGTLDGTCPSSAPVVNFVADFSIFDFPFMFTSTQQVDSILDGELGRELLDKLEAQNMIGMNFWEMGFLNVTNNKHPISKVEDFKGVKIRTMENEVQMATLTALGANPTPMAFSELFTALQQGTVDGQQNPLATISAQKYYEVQKYLTISQHVYNPYVFIISKKFWDGLTDEEKEIFQTAADAGRDEERRLIREQNKTLLSELEKAGMQISYMDEGEIEKMKRLAQPVIDEYSQKIDTDFVERIYAAVEAID